MSELVHTCDTAANRRQRFLSTVSAFALLTSILSSIPAEADDDSNRPTVWIELGGQLERVDGANGRFSAPFLTKAPTPAPFSPISPLDAGRAPRYGFGEEGKISFDPNGTNWVFSAAIRYGRSNSNKTVKHQTDYPVSLKGSPSYRSLMSISAAQFSKTFAKLKESHTVLDFMAGKDVGLGMFGRESSAVIDFGVRYAQFQSSSNVRVYARPSVHHFNAWPAATHSGYPYIPGASFNQYSLIADSSRSFHGVGPSLSLTASVPMVGDHAAGEFKFDWGVNAAVLFGRQRAYGSHETQASHYRGARPAFLPSLRPNYTSLYHTQKPFARSRTITAPNVGGFAAISLKFPNAKVSLGYRADFFFGAMDTGIDARKTATTGFHGPFATISIGLGG
jgi:hypothetical protein